MFINKWYLVRHLNLADHNPRRITKADKDFSKRLDFKDIKCLVIIRDIHKIKKKKKKKNRLALPFLVMKTKKNIQSMYQNDVVKKTC